MTGQRKVGGGGEGYQEEMVRVGLGWVRLMVVVFSHVHA